MSPARAQARAAPQDVPRGPRLTPAVVTVLGVFLRDPARPRYNLELSRATGMEPPAVFQVLGRLSRAGWLASSRQPARADGTGHVRRMYRLTPAGLAGARAAAGAPAAARRARAPARPPAGGTGRGPGLTAARVLGVFLDVPGPHHLTGLTASTGLAKSTAAKALARLAAAGWLSARMEPRSARRGPGRRRRLYTLTPAGRAAAPGAVAAARAWLAAAPGGCASRAAQRAGESCGAGAPGQPGHPVPALAREGDDDPG